MGLASGPGIGYGATPCAVLICVWCYAAGMTALHYAARNGSVTAIDYLLSCGADPNKRLIDDWGSHLPPRCLLRRVRY
eukprot:3581658-Rhodomonas_salina.3